MNRRDFIRYTLLSGAALGSTSFLRRANAEVPVNDKRVILFLMLRGGPDFRHMIAPPYDSEW